MFIAITGDPGSDGRHAPGGATLSAEDLYQAFYNCFPFSPLSP